jgi:hypothetical protein
VRQRIREYEIRHAKARGTGEVIDAVKFLGKLRLEIPDALTHIFNPAH